MNPVVGGFNSLLFGNDRLLDYYLVPRHDINNWIDVMRPVTDSTPDNAENGVAHQVRTVTRSTQTFRD